MVPSMSVVYGAMDDGGGWCRRCRWRMVLLMTLAVTDDAGNG